MGRGQQRAAVTDQFAAIMGNRRGLRPEQVPQSSIPNAREPVNPFAQEGVVAERRLELVRWWLHRNNPLIDTPMMVKAISDTCGLCERIRSECRGGPGVQRRLQESILRGDLIALVKQGVCDVSHKRSRNYYGILPPEKWSQDHQEAYARASHQE